MSFDDLDALLRAESPSPEETAALHPVIVVDDDPAIRTSLASLLNGRYQVILCASAKEAAATITDDICTVILDIKMGMHDGFWACDAPVAWMERWPQLLDGTRSANAMCERLFDELLQRPPPRLHPDNLTAIVLRFRPSDDTALPTDIRAA